MEYALVLAFPVSTNNVFSARFSVSAPSCVFGMKMKEKEEIMIGKKGKLYIAEE
jgi:hypothetical protein